jgi:hypothetical protein
MQKLPKLRIETSALEPAEIQDYDMAIDLPYNKGLIIALEGYMVSNHDEFLRVIDQYHLRDKEIIEVKILPIVLGG